ncbi:MAG TPA: glutamine--scyllo-inositol aminotransferase [Firmicutes bacterium]|jgi:8-amino-3,8-dideoxy-alpha-D-manno-octulosonate transaminase|nr:glutamine--scyllo-inositol aminotransferase [Bacillota bacterium]
MKDLHKPVYPGAFVYGAEENQSVAEVIENQSPFRYYGPAVQGKVSAFEKEATQFLGSKYGLAVSSGTAALMVALRALGVGPGDEVIIPSVTFIACAGSVVSCNAVPIFCDVDDSLNIDPEALERCITPRTKVIMVVHFQGSSADMDRIMDIAKRHKLKVIEDSAQSFAAAYKGKYVGTIGDIGTFSLQLNKTITAGEGGLVVTNDEHLYKRMIMAHDQGNIRDASGHVVVDPTCPGFYGENYRMNELTGAVALMQLRKVSDIVEKMQNNARKIIAGLNEIPNLSWRKNYDEAGCSYVSLAIYLPTAEDTIEAVKKCKERKVPGTRLYQGLPTYAYPFVLNKLTAHSSGCPFTCPYYKGTPEYRMGMCPKAEDLISRALFIQVSPLLTNEDIDYIVKNLKEIIR